LTELFAGEGKGGARPLTLAISGRMCVELSSCSWVRSIVDLAEVGGVG
jgi:hypothetical protein